MWILQSVGDSADLDICKIYSLLMRECSFSAEISDPRPQFSDSGTDGAVGDYFDGVPIVRLADGRAHCKLCDTVLKTVSIARQHATRIHMSVAAECVLCARVYKNEKSFAMHLIRVHGLRGVEKPLENYGRVIKSDAQ